MSLDLLPNVVWHALTGPQADVAVGRGNARRYAPGFSPILAFAAGDRPDFEALAPFCEPGERLYCDGWAGDAPPGWRIDAESTMFKMVFDAPRPPDDAGQPVRLRGEHHAEALALATLTRPGPFGPRTPELGEYIGFFEDGRLVAMAGERMRAGTLREVSGVCTHPDWQGRGLARRLVAELVRRELRRGETAFLHVMRDNEGARRLYERMGFRVAMESVVRVVSRA